MRFRYIEARVTEQGAARRFSFIISSNLAATRRRASRYAHARECLQRRRSQAVEIQRR